jgi:hypothetical protein
MKKAFDSSILALSFISFIIQETSGVVAVSGGRDVVVFRHFGS